MNKTQKAMFDAMVSSGKSYSAIHGALLALDIAKDTKAADKILADAGIVKARKKAIIDNMYDYLEEAPRTQADFYSWIKEHGTNNTWNWRKQHDKVRLLTNKLHINLSGVDFTEVPYKEEEKKEESKES